MIGSLPWNKTSESIGCEVLGVGTSVAITPAWPCRGFFLSTENNFIGNNSRRAGETYDKPQTTSNVTPVPRGHCGSITSSILSLCVILYCSHRLAIHLDNIYSAVQ